MLKKLCRSIGRISGKIINKIKDKSFLRKLRILGFGFLAGDLLLDMVITAPVVGFLYANGMASAALYTALGMTAVSLLLAYMAYLYLLPTIERNIP